MDMPVSDSAPLLGTLFVVAAPSGAGKTSLVQGMLDRIDHLTLSVSYTTRLPREGEQSGVHYYFVPPETFNEMVVQGAFLEHATVYGKSYGTSKQWVMDQLASGDDVLLEIDWKGAAQVQSLFPQAVTIFILPPTIETLRARLEGRKQDAAEVIDQRMAQATEEMSHYSHFDYLVINELFDDALAQLCTIVRACRLATPRQIGRHEELLSQLLA